MSKNRALYICIFLFFVYTILNIYASQQFNSLFFHLVTRQKKDDAVLFLKKIQKTAYFSDQLSVFTRLYGASIQEDLQKETEERDKKISQLEALLEKNKYARDVLIKLALLYYENDHPSRAKNYYQKAQTIDPEININELDKL
ncbi:MAG TPA: hypothetical protein VJB63_02905 [Patescibacteria group bacterium]|nr:hypothetical protein [Patescibacteria group bacterium]